MDVMRADLLTLAEQGDYGRVKLIIEEVLGRKFHGLLPMHASYIPTTCPVDRMPSSGCYKKRKPWTDGLLAAYPPGYYLAIGENVVTTPTAAQPWGRAALRPDEWFDASALTMCEWRNASGLQPAPFGFQKKNCASEYYVGPDFFAMRGVVFFRNEDEARFRWNHGQPVVQILQIAPKSARIIPHRD